MKYLLPEEEPEEKKPEAEKPKVKVKPKAKGKAKPKAKKAVVKTPEHEPEEPGEEIHNIEDEIPEGHVDFYEGDEGDAPHGTYTEDDEIFALYELLKTTRDLEDDDDGNPFKHE